MKEALEEPLLLRVKDAAQILAVSKSKLYELINANVIPSIRIGTSLRIPVDRLRHWIEKETAPGSGGGL